MVVDDSRPLPDTGCTFVALRQGTLLGHPGSILPVVLPANRRIPVNTKGGPLRDVVSRWSSKPPQAGYLFAI